MRDIQLDYEKYKNVSKERNKGGKAKSEEALIQPFYTFANAAPYPGLKSSLSHTVSLPISLSLSLSFSLRLYNFVVTSELLLHILVEF